MRVTCRSVLCAIFPAPAPIRWRSPRSRPCEWLADDCIAAAAGGASRVWYVTFDKLEDEMIELVEDDPHNARYDSLGWLRAHYDETGVRRFNDLNVYRFDNPDSDALQAQCSTD